MYARKEHIEEEILDWGEELTKIDHPETVVKTDETKHIIHSNTKDNKFIFKKKVKFRLDTIKRYINDLLDEFTEISLLLSLLIAPYMIGFFIVSVILIYGGVPIDRFFSLKEGVFHFELWSIGAYIFITGGVIWLVSMLSLHRA